MKTEICLVVGCEGEKPVLFNKVLEDLPEGLVLTVGMELLAGDLVARVGRVIFNTNSYQVLVGADVKVKSLIGIRENLTESGWEANE